MSKVAFCGLGQMGAPMAGRLIDAGHHLTVWNRSPDKAAPLVARGARQAGSPAEAAADAEAIITMVATPEAVEEVLFGREGAAEGSVPGGIMIEMSTIGPFAVRQLAERLPARVEMIDAPVLGTIPEARNG